MCQSFLFYCLENATIVPMKDYKLTHQFNIHLFFKKVVSTVAPTKVENTKILSDDERKEIVRRIQKEYNLSEEQIIKYLDMNISCTDVLKMFLEIDGLGDKYEEYETKRCAKPAMYHHLGFFLALLIFLIFFNVVIGFFAYKPTGYIVMASLDLLFIPFIVFEFVRLYRICSFMRDKNVMTNEYKKITILNYRSLFTGHIRWTTIDNRYYTLLYLILDCEIDGQKKRIWCFADDMINVFPVKSPFSFFKIIKSLSKSIKGKTISGKCFLKHNVLVGRNSKMSHLINSFWKGDK